MALRKDKVAAALAEMKGICTSADEPASLPNTINQLADILGELFDDISIDPLPPIDTGIDGLPDDDPFDFPTGGGDVPPFDPGGGFDGSPPGGGGEFGEDGGDGGEGGGGGGCLFSHIETQHLTYLARAEGEIPAAENGNPAIGTANVEVVVESDPAQVKECKDKCREDHEQDLKDANKLLKTARFGSEDEVAVVGWDHTPSTEFIVGRAATVGAMQDKVQSIKDMINKCLTDCEGTPNPEGPQKAGCPLIVQNISCEAIEDGTQIVISGTAKVYVYLDANGDSCTDFCADIVPGSEDMYVIVEACGCDEEEE
jgi:hypothetical protein